MNIWRNLVILVLRLFCGILFVYAASDKIIHPQAFSDTVLNYHLLPRQLVNVFSLWLPWLELVVGVLILSGVWARACAALLSGMMAMFLVAIAQAVFRGINIHCGCFTQGGEATDPVSILTIARDMSFLLATLLAFWLESEVPTWRLFTRKVIAKSTP